MAGAEGPWRFPTENLGSLLQKEKRCGMMITKYKDTPAQNGQVEWGEMPRESVTVMPIG